MKLYLAGPRTGIPDFNHPEFNRVAAELRKHGHDVFSPAEFDRSNGYDFTGFSGDQLPKNFSRREALAADLEYIALHAQGVALLGGWYSSKGARCEIATAEALGIPVWLASEFLRSGVNAPTILLSRYLPGS